MPVAVEIQIPGLTPEHYEQMMSNLGPSLSEARGFLAHSASPMPGGWRLVEIWQSEQDWGQFAQEKVAPLAQAFGMTVPPPTVQSLHRFVTPLETAGGPAVSATVIGADEGKTLRLGPIEILIKEDGSGMRQKMAVAEFRGKRYRIPPHTHTEHDENIVVLEGPIELFLGGKTYRLQTGDSFTIPIKCAPLHVERQRQGGALPEHHRARPLSRILQRALPRRDGAPPSARGWPEDHAEVRAPADRYLNQWPCHHRFWLSLHLPWRFFVRDLGAST